MGEELDLILDNMVNNESFSNTVNFTISSIEFDPEADIISRNNSVTLGVPDSLLDNKIRMFPNPTSNSITIKKPESLKVNEIRIFNIIGQLIYKSEWTPVVNMNSYLAGLLLVQFQTNKGIINKSLLKN